jgi:predicted nucleic acid-binding protein
MNVFGDTVYFIALLSTRDRWHPRAVAISRQPPGPLITTEWVLTEVGDAFSQPGARQKFIQLLNVLRQQADVEIVSSSDLFRRGTDFFAARPDKEWSLTDCISFVVMIERGITGALSSDHHFGFQSLLKD